MSGLQLNSESSSVKRISVIGAGAFGTSLATIAARNGHDVILWARDEAVVSGINTNHVNNNYLSTFTLLDNISATSDVREALTNVDMIILALPAQIVPDFLRENKDIIDPGTLLCNSAKGLYLKEKCLLSEAIPPAMGRDQPYAVLSGPSFAKEMMLGHPTAVVAASKYLYHSVTIQRLLSSSTFKVFTSQDILGVQLGGSLKNPLAIGAGIIEGKKLGLSGIGDLMLTAFGDLSRNRSCGLRMARGESVSDITKDMTVEGIYSAKVAVSYADACGLELPIFRTVEAIIDGRMTLEEAQEHLMGLPLSRERVATRSM